jgi:hypothetical protein
MWAGIIIASISLLGVVLAALLAYFSQQRASSRAVLFEVKQLRLAFVSELSAAQLSFERRLAVIRIARTRLGTELEVALIPRALTISSFPIYEANLSRIGLLPQDALAAVVNFYSRALMLGEESALLGSPWWHTLQPYQKESILARYDVELDRLVNSCLRARMELSDV